MQFEVRANEKKRFLEAINKRVDAKLNDVVDEIFMRATDNLATKRITDTGFLAGSGSVNHEFLRKELIFKAGYAGRIEFGSPPHYVSPKQLVKWVHRKIGLSDDEAWGMAYAVSKKIGEQGTEPHPFLTPAIQSVKIRFGGA